MNGLTSLAISSIIVLVASGVFLKSRFTRRISPTIPYAGEGSFASRITVLVKYRKDPINFLLETREQHGDVFCVDLFVTKFVFLLGPEGNREVLRAPEERLSFWEQVRWAMGPVLLRGKEPRILLLYAL